ncbi:MAG: L,D-transpeptidase family protein [Sphingomicrobium sp.]
MNRRFRIFAVFSALVAGPISAAWAQQALPSVQAAQTPPPVPQPAPPPGLAPAPDVLAPIVLPPPIWTAGDARELLGYIQRVGGEGLNPVNYDPAGLDVAIRSGVPEIMSKAANDRFNWLSSDLALGFVPRKERVQWFIQDGDLSTERQDQLLRSAVQQHSITATLNSLLPTHAQYAALKNALMITPPTDVASVSRIRLNMDRWRWLPRDLGNKYIIVNVPAFHATLVENGVNRWKHKAIAGAPKTPTPQLSVLAVGVMFNPWWEVPPSISKEVAGKPGYVALKDKDGKLQRWRQPPGPSNALGQMKFVMYNPQNIYLHDTNARSRFSSRMRALSHGCIRTEHIHDLATELLGDDGGEWIPEKIQATLTSKKTVQANFVKPVPVFIVYFSAAALNDGKIVNYDDMYGRDAKVLVALNAVRGSVGAKMAAR